MKAPDRIRPTAIGEISISLARTLLGREGSWLIHRAARDVNSEFAKINAIMAAQALRAAGEDF